MTEATLSTTDPMLKIPEIARRLGVSTTTVYDLVKKGEVPAFKLGSQWMIRESTLTAWIAKQEQRASSAGE